MTDKHYCSPGECKKFATWPEPPNVIPVSGPIYEAYLELYYADKPSAKLMAEVNARLRDRNHPAG